MTCILIRRFYHVVWVGDFELQIQSMMLRYSIYNSFLPKKTKQNKREREATIRNILYNVRF